MTITTPYGMTFTDEAEQAAWEAQMHAELDEAEQSPLLSDAQAQTELDALQSLS